MSTTWRESFIRYSYARNFAEEQRDCPAPAEIRQALVHLHTVERTLARCRPLVEAALAAQGDTADRDLIDLQHCLAALLQPPADQKPELLKTS